MAKQTHTTNLSETRPQAPVKANRRQVMKSLPAGLALCAGSLAVSGPCAADTRLLSLVAEHDSAYELFGEAVGELDRAEEAARQRYPQRPDSDNPGFSFSQVKTDQGTKYEVELREQEIERYDTAQAQKLSLYKAECAEIDERFGVKQADEKRAQLCALTEDLLAEIIATPAQSMAGVQAKLRLWIETQGHDPEAKDLVTSAAQDAEVLS